MMMIANWRVVAVGCLVPVVLGPALELDAAAAEKAAVLTGTVTGVSGQVFFGQVFDGSDESKPLSGGGRAGRNSCHGHAGNSGPSGAPPI